MSSNITESFTPREKKAFLKLEKKKLETQQITKVADYTDKLLDKITSLVKSDTSISFFLVEGILSALAKSKQIDEGDFLKWSGINLGLNVLRASSGSEAGSIAGVTILGMSGVVSATQEIDKLVEKRKEDLFTQSGINPNLAKDNKILIENMKKQGIQFRILYSPKDIKFRPDENCLFYGFDLVTGLKVWMCPLSPEQAKNINPLYEGALQIWSAIGGY